MKEIVLIGGVAAIFFFGYVLMGKLDRFLEDMQLEDMRAGEENADGEASGRSEERVV